MSTLRESWIRWSENKVIKINLKNNLLHQLQSVFSVMHQVDATKVARSKIGFDRSLYFDWASFLLHSLRSQTQKVWKQGEFILEDTSYVTKSLVRPGRGWNPQHTDLEAGRSTMLPRRWASKQEGWNYIGHTMLNMPIWFQVDEKGVRARDTRTL